MTYFYLTRYGSKETLYEGKFANLIDCLEEAVSEGVCLDYIDLCGANLVNANLDDAILNYARLDHANLTGVNLSAAELKGASFYEANLCNACLCEADMEQAKFFGAFLGAADIAWGNLKETCFDTLSALDLKFSDSLMMKGAMFYDRTGTICGMSHAPLVIKGLQYPIVLFDQHMKVGSVVLSYASWLELQEKEKLLNFGSDVSAFIMTYGPFLFSLARIRSSNWKEGKQFLRKNVA